MQEGFSSEAYTISESVSLSFKRTFSCKAFSGIILSSDNHQMKPVQLSSENRLQRQLNQSLMFLTDHYDFP